ncbi:MAG: hypothetical protein WCZ65_09020 [Lysobacteraceae bacterium]
MSSATLNRRDITRRGLLALASLVVLALALWHWRGSHLDSRSQTSIALNEPEDDTSADTQDAVATTPTVNNRQPPAERLALPHDYALFPGLSVPVASSWEELLAGLSPEEREVAQAFADLYPEAYQFRTREQLEWMVANGYPMPEEIIAARQMPLEDLVNRAMSGNVKAGMLARDRLLDELLAEARDESVPFNENRRYIEKDAAMRRIKYVESQRNCSPFTMYIAARHFEGMDKLNLSLAAHNVLYSMGDIRVQGLVDIMTYNMSLNYRDTSSMARSAVMLSRAIPTTCRHEQFPLYGR